MEIIDIDSGRMTITMKGLKRDEFGVNEIRRGREREKKKLRSNKVIFFEERALISKSESSWTEIEVATRGERESERGRGNRKKLAQWVA